MIHSARHGGLDAIAVVAVEVVGEMLSRSEGLTYLNV